MIFTPEHYQLRIEPDLERFSSPGIVTIRGTLNEKTSQVRLDARDLDIDRVELSSGADPAEKVAYTIVPEEQALDIDLGRPCSGTVSLTVHFTATINDRLAGLYRASYRENGETRYMAITQFEETDARAAFPCIDRPKAKASFDIEFVVAAGLTGISNTAIVADEPLADGRHCIRFATTPKMSTYLLFFGIGDFDFVENTSWRIPVRCAARPGQAQYGHEAILWTIESLRFGEEYTGHAFPIDKMDLIACTDFAFGAMENYGAISFRENRVLIWPGTTPAAERERVCQITNHEVAHMWFGDLVSPEDWSYVWLNEAFATYFGYVITDAFHPEFEGLEQFVANQMQVAFHRDALRPTVPVEFPEGQELEFGPATTPIIYRKAASILRMFRLYLGDCGLQDAADGDATTPPERAAFREGVRAYVDAHAHETADTDSFLKTFEEGVHRVTDAPEFRKETLESWIRTPGYPLVEATRNERTLHLKKSRFTYLPEDTPSETPPVPLTIRYVLNDGSSQTVSVLMPAQTLDITIPDGVRAVKLNADQAGFYRVSYSNTMLYELGPLCAEKVLGSRDRFSVLYDLHALVVAGTVRLEAYLEYLKAYFTGETEFLPTYQIARSLTELQENAATKAALIAETGRSLLQAAGEQMGLEPSDGEPHTRSILRETVFWALYVFEDTAVGQAVRDTARVLVDSADSESVHPDLRSLLYRIAACESEALLRNMLIRLSDPACSESESQEITAALGHVRGERLLAEMLDYVMEHVPTRNRFLMLSAASSNSRAANAMWDWFVSNQEKAHRLPRFHLLTALVLFARSAGAERSEDVQAFFAAYRRDNPDVGNETIAMALEEHAVRVGLNRNLEN
ncbi:MAG: M1 family peptidase [Spirochaetaceae bacterium]|nr:MAG: M1 family peptidase [Spirochaetaceae bacterium]